MTSIVSCQASSRCQSTKYLVIFKAFQAGPTFYMIDDSQSSW